MSALATLGSARSKARDFLELTKPRVVQLVAVTTALGWFLGRNPGAGSPGLASFLATVCGSILVCAGVGVANQVLETRRDGLMDRTRNRPLPSGRMSRSLATVWAVLLMVSGIVWHGLAIGPWMAVGSFLTAFIYLAIYTPLKVATVWNTFIGALPGALPPLGGWFASSGQLDLGGWVLFGLLFCWQFPHFYAIAWRYRSDYEKGGHLMLPVVDPDGRRTGRQSLFYSLGFLGFSLIPLYPAVMAAHPLYVASLLPTFLIGALYVRASLAFLKSPNDPRARTLLRTSVLVLPLAMALKGFERFFL